MSEYIFNVPDSNQPIAGDSAVYYPDERDDPMIVREEIVRCMDCVKFSEQEPNGEIGTCELGLEDTGLVSIVEPSGFCAWGERRMAVQ